MQPLRTYQPAKRHLSTGVGLAIVATLIWSGNFVVARGVYKDIPPVALAFFRWLIATLVILPFAWKSFKMEQVVVIKNIRYLFWVALTGITLFNTFIYVAAHFTTAINLALIGTTSSPIFSMILAALFLKEIIRPLRLAGLLICLGGIVLLLCQGSFSRLIAFRFSTGDWWILLAAFLFAVYNTLVKRKPAEISPLNFLFIIFGFGTILLLPIYLLETRNSPPVQWNTNLAGAILYLGIGASVLAYLCWNMAISRLGSARTALFGNLIPLFSTLEAVWILHEQITLIHLLSGLLIIFGLIVANLKKANASLR